MLRHYPRNAYGKKGEDMTDKQEIKEKKRSDRGVVVTPKPNDPENIHLSKAQFIAKQKALKEKALKVAEYAASLDNKKEVAPEVKEEKKSRGRPRKIE